MNEHRRGLIEQINYWKSLSPVVDRLVLLDQTSPLILKQDAVILRRIFAGSPNTQERDA